METVMDEIEKILLKNAALIRARNYLREQSPSDMVAIADLTENIVDLTSCHVSAADIADVPQITPEEQKLLRQAITALDDHVGQKASPVLICDKARAVYGLRPWPPKVPAYAAVRGLRPVPKKP
jgi:hypothetical protein